MPNNAKKNCKGKRQKGGEGLKQRFVDARNYLLLLAACLEEEAGIEA